jgi:predicted Zn finger-like uncharacterized protein
MKVVCDNCGAVYKIPEHKLVKEVNKATCRKCGHRIMIRRDAPERADEPESNEEATVIAEAAKVGVGPASIAVSNHPSFGSAPEEPTPLPTSPMDGPAPAAQPQQVAPMAGPAPSYAQQAAPVHSPAATGVPMGERSHDSTGELTVILLGATAAGVGALILALAGGNFLAHFAGLFMALWGAFMVGLVVITSGWGRKPAWLFLSLFVSLVLAGVFSAAVNPLTVDLITGKVNFGEIDALAQRVSDAAQQVQEVQPEPEPEPTEPTEPTDDGASDADGVADADGAADEDGAPTDLLDVLATEEPEPEPEPDATHVPEPEPVKEPEPRASSPSTSSSSSSSSSRSGSSSSSSPSTSSSSSSRSGGSSSSSPSTSSSSSSRSGSSSSSSPSTSSSSSSRQPTSTSSSSSSGSKQTTIPTTVIDIQIRNNKNIKACFLAHKKSTGELPSVTLRFTLEPDGSVSSASIREAAYQGSALESCLSGSIKMIDFQDFDGPAYTLNYPFRF